MWRGRLSSPFPRANGSAVGLTSPSVTNKMTQYYDIGYILIINKQHYNETHNNHAYIPVGGVNTLHLFAPSICTTRTSCLSVCGGADVRIPRAVTYMLSAPGSDIASVLAKVGPARRGMCAPILLKMTVPDYILLLHTPPP